MEAIRGINRPRFVLNTDRLDRLYGKMSEEWNFCNCFSMHVAVY